MEWIYEQTSTLAHGRGGQRLDSGVHRSSLRYEKETNDICGFTRDETREILPRPLEREREMSNTLFGLTYYLLVFVTGSLSLSHSFTVPESQNCPMLAYRQSYIVCHGPGCSCAKLCILLVFPFKEIFMS